MKRFIRLFALGVCSLLPAFVSSAATRTISGVTWSYTITNDTARIDSASPSRGELTMPDSLSSLPVARIAEDAFFDCSKLTSMSLPSSLRQIGSGAFYGCTALTSVTFASGVTDIGEMAFYGCSELRTVALPATVATIGMTAFGGCPRLTAISVASGNAEFASSDGILYSKDLTELVAYPGGRDGLCRIPSGVTAIGDGAFAVNWQLTNVAFAASVKTIGRRAFWKCTRMTSLTLPSGVAQIGSEAFAQCGKLQTVTIPTSVTSIGLNAFNKCSSLRTVRVTPGDAERVRGLLESSGCETRLLTFATVDGREIVRTVTLDPNGGTCGETKIEVGYGACVGELPVPVRGGYDFDGWFTAVDGGSQVAETTPVVANVTYYAHWSAIGVQCTVSFDPNGGSVGESSRTVSQGRAIGSLPLPTREGYDFDGWYTAKSGGDYIYASTKVSASFVCYAHWSETVGDEDEGDDDDPGWEEDPDTCVVTFDANGGGVDEICRNVTIGTSVGDLPVATRKGHQFDGWFTEGSGGLQIVATTKVSADVTYYAHWTACAYSVKVDGVEAETVFRHGDVFRASTFASVTNALTNIVCTGWVGTGSAPASGSGNEVSFTVTEASTLAWRYATNYWVAVGADVSFAPGEGGSVVVKDAAGEAIASELWATDGTTLTAEATPAEGWLFAGWRDENGDALQLTDEATFVFDVIAPVSLVAVFTQQVFEVVLDGVATNVVYGETVRASTFASVTNALTNIVCTGWVGTGSAPASGSGNEVSFTVTEASTLAWRYATNYWVAVGANASFASGESGSVVVKDAAGETIASELWATDGTTLTAEATPAEGWLFAGWRDENGDARQLSSETPFAFDVVAPVSLVAVFTQQVFGVVLDGVVTNVVYGETVRASTFASVTNSLTNVVCTGWVGTGSVPASGSGSEVSFTVTEASTLAWRYATNYWVAVGANASFASGEGGSVVVKDAAGETIASELWATDGTTLTAEATPAEGWLFAGWRDESGDARQLSSETPFAFDVVAPVSLVAIFTQRVFTVTFDLGDLGARSGGGETVQSVVYGECALPPSVAAERGYAFEGWLPADAAISRITNDTTFVATYLAGAYSIVYADTKGCANPNPTAYTVEDEITFKPLTPPPGWVFLGWNPAAIAKGTTGDVEVAAQWKQIMCRVDLDGVVVEDFAYGETVRASTFASVTNSLTNVVCTGWVGTGSAPASGSGNEVSFTVTEASTLAWRYATNYWVSVDASVSSALGEGGRVVVKDAAGVTIANELWATVGTNLTAEATPAEGWLFAGWRDESGEVLKQSDETTFAFDVIAPVSLVAVFTQRVFTVTFVLGEHLTRTGGGALVQTVAYGECAMPPEVVADTGYAFAGWQPADEVSGRVTGDRTFSATVTPPAIIIPMASEYVPKVEIEPIPVSCRNAADATIAVTGLPSGLKFSGNVITGTPAKSGVSVVTVTASVAETDRGGKAVTEIASTNLLLVVADRGKGEYLVMADVELAGEEGSSPSVGKVTGSGVCKSGKTVTLKATAAKGYVFAGWFSGDSSASDGGVLLSDAARYAFAMPSADVAVRARFVTAADDAASIRATVNGIALDLQAALATNVFAGVKVSWPVTGEAASATSVKVSGLPSGLSFKNGAITGVPTSASKTKTDRTTGVVTVVPSAVKVSVTTAGKATQTHAISLTVDALPVAGAYAGVSYAGADEGDGSPDESASMRTNGAVSVSVTAAGKIVAKQPFGGKTVSFAASGFDRYDRGEDVFVATLTAKVGGAVVTNRMVAFADDVSNGALADFFEAWACDWTSSDRKALARRIAKAPALTLDVVESGQSGTLTLKFGSAGKVSVVGKFKTGERNGRDVYVSTSASSVLCPSGDSCYRLVVALPAKGAFVGLVRVLDLVWDEESFSVVSMR